MQHLESTAADFPARFAALLHGKREAGASVEPLVKTIIEDVIARGDDALIDMTQRFDALTLTPDTLRIPPEVCREAFEQTPQDQRSALELAASRIRAHHEKQKPEDHRYHDPIGVELGTRWTALSSVGLYVPGGTASYPSSVLMNTIPAIVAGVERIVMVVPTPRGEINPLVLAAAHLAGVHEIYRIGGAQAVAALAYGTQTIAPVDKIVGPGNAYVATAKKLVFGQVGIDSIAGPSEVVIVADETANPEWIAADLLAQAEHDKSAQSILITSSPELAHAVAVAVDLQLADLPRRNIADQSWQEHGAIITVPAIEDAIPLVNALAAEHVEIMTDAPDLIASHIHHAGALFLGHMTPEAIGDYVGGSNHVLPTARAARYASGLGVLDFMKRTSLLRCGPEQLEAIGPAAVTLALCEGLHAHARSVQMRLERT